MHITFLAFNYEYAGNVVNGPGICLKNFIKILNDGGISTDVFTILPAKNSSVYSINDHQRLSKSLSKSNYVHAWSGLDNRIRQVLKKTSKKIILGPNVLDGVKLKEEKDFLGNLKIFKFLTINEKLKHEIEINHGVSSEIFLIGPDLDLWKPIKEKDNTILWKGNSKQYVKDVEFALKVRDALPKYHFKFIGYPNRYIYSSHIQEAKKSRIQIVTSLSETMGMSMLEGWASGLPSVSHPKIYYFGENYKTGIITNKTIKDYTEAVRNLMEDELLYEKLKASTVEHMVKNFSPEITYKRYMQIIR